MSLHSARVAAIPPLDPADGRVDFPLLLSSKKFTQELRLSSLNGVNTEWLAGVHFDHERAGITSTSMPSMTPTQVSPPKD
jgi:hypothetical protein